MYTRKQYLGTKLSITHDLKIESIIHIKVNLIHTQEWICLQHNRGRHSYVVKARWWHDFVLTTPPDLRRSFVSSLSY